MLQKLKNLKTENRQSLVFFAIFAIFLGPVKLQLFLYYYTYIMYWALAHIKNQVTVTYIL